MRVWGCDNGDMGGGDSRQSITVGTVACVLYSLASLGPK